MRARGGLSEPLLAQWDSLRGRSREGAAVAPGLALALAAMAAITGAPMVWFMASVMAVALALGQGRWAWLSMLPGGAILLLTTTMLLPLGAGVLQINVLHSAAATRGLLVLGAIVTVVWAVHLDAGERVGPERSRVEIALIAAPGTLMLGLLAVLVTTGSSRLSWFLSGDHLRHLGLTTRTLEAGALEYEMLSYPHGWHALMAMMWAATGSSRDGAGLRTLVEMQAVATWTILVLIPLALGLIAATLARARGLGPERCGFAGLVAGSLVLGPAFYGDYVPRGFDTTLLVLLAISAAVHSTTVAPRSALALATAVSATVVTSHSWQVLLAPAGFLAAMVLWQRRRAWRGRGRGLVSDVGTVGAGAVASLPGVAAAIGGFGLAGAADAGDVPPPVFGWIIVVVIAAGFVVLQGGQGQISIVVAVVAAALLTCVLLARVAGVGVSSYYPSKTLWVAAALGLPAVGCFVTMTLARLDGGSLLRRAGYVVVGCATVLVVLLSSATPLMGVLASAWGSADANTVMRAVTTESAPAAIVVWRLSDDVDDATAQLLLDFYSASAVTPRLGLAPRTVDEQCALLLRVREPVVMSNAPKSDVRARFACVPGVSVVTGVGGR